MFRDRLVMRLGTMLLLTATVVPACSDDSDDADATSSTPVPPFTEPDCDEDAQVAALEQAFAEVIPADRERPHRRVADAAANNLLELGEDGVLGEECLVPNVRLRTAVTLRFLVNADADVRAHFDERLEDVPDQIWAVAEHLADAWYAADDPVDREQVGDALLTFLDEPAELASSDAVDGLNPGDVRGIDEDDVDPLLTVVALVGEGLQRVLRDMT